MKSPPSAALVKSETDRPTDRRPRPSRRNENTNDTRGRLANSFSGLFGGGGRFDSRGAFTGRGLSEASVNDLTRHAKA